jgi:hypothetical protein
VKILVDGQAKERQIRGKTKAVVKDDGNYKMNVSKVKVK